MYSPLITSLLAIGVILSNAWIVVGLAYAKSNNVNVRNTLAPRDSSTAERYQICCYPGCNSCFDDCSKGEACAWQFLLKTYCCALSRHTAEDGTTNYLNEKGGKVAFLSAAATTAST